MGVRLIVDPAGGSDSVAMFDSVSGFAFGPVFSDPGDAVAFLDWLPKDARTYSDKELDATYSAWLKLGKPTVAV